MKEEGSRFVVTSIKVLPCGSVWLLSEEERGYPHQDRSGEFSLSPEMYSVDNRFVPGARGDVYEDASRNEWMLTDNGLGMLAAGSGALYVLS